MTNHKYTNKLINEKSPYLLQHAHNPVNWHPWGDEAFEKATSEDKPIFLSIGYSTCHWCHVLERESFEDLDVAETLNKNFIAIKVDREERPDIDHIYMSICIALTGSGGWPLTIIMTPDKKPFYAGTYFPKNDRMGLPGIISVLDLLSEMWAENREPLLTSSMEIVNSINHIKNKPQNLNAEKAVKEAYQSFVRNFDQSYGGFGVSPKFPTPHNLFFLLRYYQLYKQPFALQMAEKTLDSMANGGIFDHIGWGFSRYSTDRKWLVPHFEKMLYDNALLAIAYTEAYLATGNESHAETSKRVLEYLLRDMSHTEGGFYSAEDADSEGVEGKFYAWSVEEVLDVLGEKAGKQYCSYYGINSHGNFEGLNIPNLIGSEYLESMENSREKLFAHREKRVHPYKDDKILTSWNALAINAFALAARAFGDDKYKVAAEKTLNFIYKALVRKDGRLLARYRDQDSAILGYVDDYAFLIHGLVELYETTYNPEYLIDALKFNDHMIELFWDEADGGLFMYGKDSEELLSRPKEVYDGAIPSGNSVATLNFLRLGHLTGNHNLIDMAEKQFKTFAHEIIQSPTAHSFMLTAVLLSLSKIKNVVLVGHSEEMISLVQKSFLPFTLVVRHMKGNEKLKEAIPLIENYEDAGKKATAFVCEGVSCAAPIDNASKLLSMLY